MKKSIRYIVLAALILGACEQSEFQHAGDFFHLEHKGAKMPIWVKGNFNSEVMIITVHGGPGDSGMEQHIASQWKYLRNWALDKTLSVLPRSAVRYSHTIS